MALAPAGEYKVVFLENIERMNASAANAFLKTLEEPLPNRLLVATTANKESLLDTIISRAFVIEFGALTHQQIVQYIQDRHPQLSQEVQAFLAGFSLGQVGMIEQFLQHA
ncbi:MAG: hypothetical protein H6765_07395 [Candidatus Peribacteria bacterium]|nr:MAG: hypothetical protein H6765_07395 [Candidatus Peribacteria bacterium]